MSETIFITIPAYEDPYLIRTLDSAISNASNPDKIKFAIALQYKKFPQPDVSKYNADVIVYDVDNRPSINLIRHELLKFYSDQDYYMMIDSHTIFMKDWDRLIVEDYKALQHQKGSKVALSKQVGTHCGDFPKNILNEKTIWKILPPEENKTVKDPGYFSSHLKGWIEPCQISTDYFATYYVSAHFFFVSGRYVNEVGIVKAANLRSEEPVMSFVTFMNGWDIYAMNNRNHIAHMDAEYRLAAYGELYPSKRLAYNFDGDDLETIKNLDSLLINNTGMYAIQNTDRSAKDFYSAIGLLDQWESFCYTR